MIKGIVAIVGRPNVGKSTLFNALTRTHTAITHDQPGVTRDRIYGTAYYDKYHEQGFTLIDTGGFEAADERFQPFPDDVVWQQTQAAMKHAHFILFMLDGNTGLHPLDRHILKEIKQLNKPFIGVINKIDGMEQTQKTWEFFDLGIEPLISIGAKAGYQLKELLAFIQDGVAAAPVSSDAKVTGTSVGAVRAGTRRRKREEAAALEEAELEEAAAATDLAEGEAGFEDAENPDAEAGEKPAAAPQPNDAPLQVTKIALIGRPNVGKSSILNRLVGESRAIVSDIPGTTRDSISSRITYFNHIFEIIDTAGIRRKSRIKENLETFSIIRSISNIDSADLCVLVIDAKEGFSDQDAKILGIAITRAIPALIIVNKWDLIEGKSGNSTKEYAAAIYDKIGDMAYVPIVFVSCLENKRVSRIMEYCLKLSKTYAHRVSTSQVNDVLEKIVAERTPQVVKKFSKRIKFYYATQIAARPPTFIVKTNVPKELAESYKRFLIKRLKSYLGFDDIPIVVKFRKKSEGSRSADAH